MKDIEWFNAVNNNINFLLHVFKIIHLNKRTSL